MAVAPLPRRLRVTEAPSASCTTIRFSVTSVRVPPTQTIGGWPGPPFALSAGSGGKSVGEEVTGVDGRPVGTPPAGCLLHAPNKRTDRKIIARGRPPITAA